MKANSFDSFVYVFQITRKIVFEVRYQFTGSNDQKYFATVAMQFNQPKTDYERSGQCQSGILTGKALEFFNKWDKYHTLPIESNEIFNMLLDDIQELKYEYSSIYKMNDNDILFYDIVELSKQDVKTRTHTLLK